MKYIIIASILFVILLVGCTQPVIDKNTIINTDDKNTGAFIATCADSTKELVITDTPDGQIWECI